MPSIPPTFLILFLLLFRPATPTSPAGPFHDRAPRAPRDACHDSGSRCSEADAIGQKCLAIIGDGSADLEENATTENAKEVRDCICDGPYWGHFNACHDCLVSNSLYPTSEPIDVATPLTILSSSYCSPTAGRTDMRTINGFMDQATYQDDIPLETGSPEQISSYYAELLSMAAEETALVTILDSPSQILGAGGSGSGPLETGSPVQMSSYFAALTSGASTETQLVTALESGSPTQRNGGSNASTTRSTIETPKLSPTSAAVTEAAFSDTVPTIPAVATGAAPHSGQARSVLWSLTLAFSLPIML